MELLGSKVLATKVVAVALAAVGVCSACGNAATAADPPSSAARSTTTAGGTTSTTPTASTASAPPATGDAAGGIRRLTGAGQPRDGHFSDPYPLSGSTDPRTPDGLVLSGTFSELLTCPGALRAGCFSASSISVGFDQRLRDELARAGEPGQPATKAHHIYRGRDGSWHMVFTSKVTRGRTGWNVIFHAHADGVHGSSVPTRWVADHVLVGSLEHPAAANYDGKLYDDDGRLYLVYSGALASGPQVYGVVARRMTSPSQVAPGPARTLLAPERGAGALGSERRFGPGNPSDFALVETGNVAKIDGRYVMIYAVGAFDRPDYKIGVAYSDTFLPSGDGYRKVRMPDPDGVWGRGGADEIRYLVQSQQPAWPNFAGSAVQAPGVGSLVHDGGHWSLVFAGYGPSERTSGSGQFEASHRQPYFAPVDLHISGRTPVADVPERTLAQWVVPHLEPGTDDEGTAR